MEYHDQSLMVALARLEGKVDILPSLIATHASAIKTLEERQIETERDISALKATNKSNNSWATQGIAALAVIFSGISLLINQGVLPK